MRKKKIIKAFICFFALSTILLLAFMYSPWKRASSSIAVWQELCNAISRDDINAVRAVLEDDKYDLHEIRPDGVYYFGIKFNNRLVRARPDYRRTFQYFLLDWDRKQKEKVILTPGGGYVCGYVLIEDGRITFMKFP